MQNIKISFNNVELVAELYDTPTAKAIVELLPIQGRGSRWGDEIYFSISANIPQESDARDELVPGELGYWPVGQAFCIFWGPTPVSLGDEPRAASPVNVFGKLQSGTEKLGSFTSGTTVSVKAES